MPPFLNFAPLQNGMVDLQRAGERYEQALARASRDGGAALERTSIRSVNTKLIAVERSLTLSDGLPRRSWYTHQIYAPGFYTGYGVKTLPGIREAVEQKQWAEAGVQIARAARALEGCTDAIENATAALEQALK
jgi:N-acetylated-alpha-linked acidic dipeptidase